MADKLALLIVVDETATAEQRDAVTDRLQADGFDVWHHMANTWLAVHENQNKIDAIAARDSVKDVVKPASVIASAFNIDTTGFAASIPERSLKWLSDNFGPNQVPEPKTATTGSS